MTTVTCQNCHESFQITEQDNEFYKKLSVPAPTFCFTCRLQRKMIFRNDRKLVKRYCSNCSQFMISMYAPNSPFSVWCERCWLTDREPLQYGMEIDWTIPFFKQFQQLFQRVPQQHLIQKNNVNSPWVNSESQSKNCYMNAGGVANEDGAYNIWCGWTANCFDNYGLVKSQLSYSTNVGSDCYQTFFSTFVFNTRDVYYSENCVDCSNLIGCINLKNKQFYILNKQVSPDAFQAELKKLRAYAYQQEFLKQFSQLKLSQPHQYVHTKSSTDCTGDYIEHSVDCRYCFTTLEVQNTAYSVGVGFIKDCSDIFSGSMGLELSYEYSGRGDKSYKMLFSCLCRESHDVYYSIDLTNCSYCFGCVGLKNKQFCILNTQYTQPEYESFLPRLLQYMVDRPYIDQVGRRHTFGEFFPAEISPFAYNESVAQDFYPLTPAQAKQLGFGWRQRVTTYAPTIQSVHLPDIDQATLELVTQVIQCEHQGQCVDNCQQVYTIISSELEFLKKYGLPLPRLCPTCRHVQRVQAKNPLNLWKRNCQCAGSHSANRVYTNLQTHTHGQTPCSSMCMTSYAPDRPEIMYCQECFVSETV